MGGSRSLDSGPRLGRSWPRTLTAGPMLPATCWPGGGPAWGLRALCPRGLRLAPPRREIRNVELLKLRFGEAPMHFCEVMLKVGTASPAPPHTARPGRRLTPASPPGYGRLPPHQRQHP